MNHVHKRSAMTNSEGYNDPTAYQALKHVDNSAKSNTRFYAMLNEIFDICAKYDFHLEGRIIVRDKKTGQIWR